MKLNFRQKIFLAIVGVNLLFMTIMVAFYWYKDTVWFRSMKKQSLTRVENKVNQIFEKNLRENRTLDTESQWSLFQEDLGNVIWGDNVRVEIYDLNGKAIIVQEQNNEIEQEVLARLKSERKEILVEKDAGDMVDYYLYDFLYQGEEPRGIVKIFGKSEKNLIFMNIKIFAKQYFFAIIIMFILSGYIAWFISRTLMRRIRILESQMTRTNIEYLDTPILEYTEKDEISPLIDSYNNMLRKLKQQTEQLTQIEREESWREMAKQIVHEINNPLTPLKLSVQNFQRKFNPEDANNEEKVNKLTETIVHQIDVISAITQSFSDYSKAPLGNTVVDVVKTLKHSLDIFPEHIVEFHTNAEEVYHQIDETYLTRVITNIVKNGIQSIPHQDKKIKVRLDNEQHKFLISIKDNGVGISVEYQDKIFERKFTTKSTGMGIGLSVVKKIVEDYNGKIWFETEEGKGTTFYIEFYKQ